MNKFFILAMLAGYSGYAQIEKVSISKIGVRIGDGFTVSYDSTAIEKLSPEETQILKSKVTITYRKDLIQKVIKISRLDYWRRIKTDKTLPIQYQYSNSHGGRGLPRQYQKTEQAKITSPPDNAADSLISDVTFPNNESRLDLRNKYRYYKNPIFYFEANGTIGLTHRYMLVKNAKNDWDNLNLRQQNEIATFGQNYAVKLGANIKGTRNSLFVQFFWMKQGFTSKKHIVDWETGLAVPGTKDVKNSFEYGALGIGYSFSPYKPKIAAVFDTGLYLGNLLSSKNLDFRKITWGMYVSPGAKFRLTSKIDLRMMPSFYFNFETLKSASIRTGLTSLGLTTGVRCYF